MVRRLVINIQCVLSDWAGHTWSGALAQSGADEGMEVIQANYHERALELESLQNEAREEYRAAMRERGGN